MKQWPQPRGMEHLALLQDISFERMREEQVACHSAVAVLGVCMEIANSKTHPNVRRYAHPQCPRRHCIYSWRFNVCLFDSLQKFEVEMKLRATSAAIAKAELQPPIKACQLRSSQGYYSVSSV